MPTPHDTFTTSADFYARLEAWATNRTDGSLRRCLAAVVGNYAFLRRHLKPRHVSSVPTLVVGSLMVGGAGKTPIVRYLAMRCRDFGRCAVVCRGWKGQIKQATVVEPTMGAQDVGDEAVWFRKALPRDVSVIASPDLAAGQRLAERMADVIVVDDGFQSWSLPRTADIVVVKPSLASGVIPNGCLREGTSALKSADLLWSHENESEAESAARPETHFCVRSRYRLSYLTTTLGKDLPRDWLEGRRVTVASGLGRNESFLKTVLDAGAQIEHVIKCGDHRPISKEMFKGITGLPIVITEKDAVKWRHDFPAVVAGVTIEILEGSKRLDAQLDRWCRL
ncbi:MAG: tetraacyldisaccharide 4'-kinase [Myxococcota bacterium]|nr:tetraacyldisaccharide 4'-kinase [Myxococcota bacterium]